MDCEVKDNSLVFSVSADQYNEAVIYKCMYWYTGKFNVDVRRVNEKMFTVTISSKTETVNIDWCGLTEKIKQDLIDFRLRDIVTIETKAIRELIIAKAFMHYETESDPESDISDFLKFDPANV